MIAALNGAVRAGGIGLVASCDIVVAPADATFAFAEVRIGVAPGHHRRGVPAADAAVAASRDFLTGEVFTAEDAVIAGLVTIACPGEEVAARVAALTDEIRRTAPGAVAETKRLSPSSRRTR